MHAFAIGLLLVAFQVSCDGAPQRLIPEPTPPVDVSQEKLADVPPEIPVDVSQEVENECLEAHNYRRAQHGARPLVWDATLAQNAQAWADHLAATNKFDHAQNTGEGENLFKSSGDASYKDAVEAWYSEEKLYNYNHPGYTTGVGHFTQVVWKGTTKLGCAIQKRERETYIVARYSPPGNVIGTFAENVGRKTQG